MRVERRLILSSVFCAVSGTGPIKDKMVGSRMKPLAIPKMTIPNHILKKTTKMYDLAIERTITAMKVEAPP